MYCSINPFMGLHSCPEMFSCFNVMAVPVMLSIVHYRSTKNNNIRHSIFEDEKILEFWNSVQFLSDSIWNDLGEGCALYRIQKLSVTLFYFKITTSLVERYDYQLWCVYAHIRNTVYRTPCGCGDETNGMQYRQDFQKTIELFFRSTFVVFPNENRLLS